MIQPVSLSVADAARYIGMSAAFLKKARQGKTPGPPFLKFEGRSVRYLIADLDAWMLAHRREVVVSRRDDES